MSAAASRIAWLDLARGLCMVLVVLLHADFASGRLYEQSPIIYLLNMALVPLRMPLFFMVSGMLAARLLRRPAREVLVRRVLFYTYLYALWWVLQRQVDQGLAGFGPPALMESFDVPGGLVSLLSATDTKLWFLYALALFYLACLAMARLPGTARLALAVLLALPGLFEAGAAAGWPILDRFFHFPFFVLGVTWGEQVGQAAAWLGARLYRLLPGMAVWAAATVMASRAGVLSDNLAVAGLSLLALPVGLGGAAWLAAWAGRWAGPLLMVGRNTLPIYVLHPLLLHGLLLAVPKPQAMPGASWVILLTLATVLLGLLIGRWLNRIPGLLALPPLGAALRPRLAR